MTETLAPVPADRLAEIIALSRELGRPDRSWALLAEGNTSVAVGEDAMLVKASGAEMATAGAADFVLVRLADYDALLADEAAGDEDVARVFAAAVGWGSGRPSVESLLHAVCQRLPGVRAVGHTHPVAVNSVLCSRSASALVAGALFPDQVVVLGARPLLIDYHDPGLTLARVAARQLAAHLAATGTAPKVVYLVNHGMFALGATPAEVLRITEMATKVAAILLGTLAAGGPVYLTAADTERIDRRPDEVLRRARLADGKKRID